MEMPFPELCTPYSVLRMYVQFSGLSLWESDASAFGSVSGLSSLDVWSGFSDTTNLPLNHPLLFN
ncbi:hypothetical protein I7I50_06183 [Histoplasma capsulatum G186AR]|uniref:Uncharacterized protein n=1 Tax=Ajellomyces capsulatus TaxID=5037 RepID=A0A8H7YXB0_AJECA|nr:hypothetical protein I7I52_10739 [Histoplasma capsulatum]QSS67180.1 hypothetical protein I7I50_06183 [Histoplasma capsulatum G186AR]